MIAASSFLERLKDGVEAWVVQRGECVPLVFDHIADVAEAGWPRGRSSSERPASEPQAQLAITRNAPRPYAAPVRSAGHVRRPAAPLGRAPSTGQERRLNVQRPSYLIGFAEKAAGRTGSTGVRLRRPGRGRGLSLAGVGPAAAPTNPPPGTRPQQASRRTAATAWLRRGRGAVSATKAFGSPGPALAPKLPDQRPGLPEPGE
jgi:hypothetical protein